MSDKKVSEKEMLDWLEHYVVGVLKLEKAFYPYDDERVQAIRAAIEERGRLREKVEEWKEKLNNYCRYPKDFLGINEVIQNIRDFKLDRKEKK